MIADDGVKESKILIVDDDPASVRGAGLLALGAERPRSNSTPHRRPGSASNVRESSL